MGCCLGLPAIGAVCCVAGKLAGVLCGSWRRCTLIRAALRSSVPSVQRQRQRGALQRPAPRGGRRRGGLCRAAAPHGRHVGAPLPLAGGGRRPQPCGGQRGGQRDGLGCAHAARARGLCRPARRRAGARGGIRAAASQHAVQCGRRRPRVLAGVGRGPNWAGLGGARPHCCSCSVLNEWQRMRAALCRPPANVRSAPGPPCISFLQDRAAGPGSAPAAISVGAPATALMVREDHSVLGVGTAGGCRLGWVASRKAPCKLSCRRLAWRCGRPGLFPGGGVLSARRSHLNPAAHPVRPAPINRRSGAAVRPSPPEPAAAPPAPGGRPARVQPALAAPLRHAAGLLQLAPPLLQRRRHLCAHQCARQPPARSAVAPGHAACAGGGRRRGVRTPASR